MHRPYGTTNQWDVPTICQQCHHTENNGQQIWPDIFTPLFASPLLQSEMFPSWIVGIIQIPICERWNKYGMTNLTKIQNWHSQLQSHLTETIPLARKHYDWVKDEISKLLDVKVTCRCHFSWSALIVLVIDLRDLNKVTKKSVWSMPKV